MDKVKAIKVLKPLVDSYVDYANISMKEEDDDIVDALEMAIEALKALDVPDMNVGDMISKRAAIEAICKVCSMEEDYHKCDGYPETSTWCDELIALRALPSVQSELKWIPCSERMPEPRVDVLCYTDMGEMVGYYEEHIDAWYDRNDFELIVKAWLPLPKQYKWSENE